MFMQNDFKPAGYTSASPYFVVKGARKFIDLLTKLFGATEQRSYKREDGTVMHAEVKLDDTILMLAEATENFPGNTILMHVYVPNVDETYKRALELGCDKIQEPVQKEGDPDKRGGFRDFAGNNWYVSTQTA